jgi:cell wall-associated NlpC family hydrolase
VEKEELLLRFAFVAWAFALFVAGSFGVSHAAPLGHFPSTNASFARISAERSSPDLRQWISQPIVIERGHHAAAMGRFASRVLARTSLIAQRLTRSALRFLGVPYVFGGTSTSGFDCSGYVQHVFAMLGIHLPRTADAQFYAGGYVRYPHPGDLVFFQTYEPGPSHVGIYLGHGQFVHASSSHGVMVSRLSDAYWANRYLGAKNLMGR